MRISAKARYAISTMIYMAKNYNSSDCITIISLSEKLKISKIYLEQVFSQLKRANLVSSTKGPQGGYQLAKNPKDISAFEILASIETALTEKTKETVGESDSAIERAMQGVIFDKLDETINNILSNITLKGLTEEAEKYANSDEYMFNI